MTIKRENIHLSRNFVSFLSIHVYLFIFIVRGHLLTTRTILSTCNFTSWKNPHEWKTRNWIPECMYMYTIHIYTAQYIFFSLFHFQSDGDLCYGCGDLITERFLLHVNGQAWHVGCLRCCICQIGLERQTSCFIREDNIYCRNDYSR